MNIQTRTGEPFGMTISNRSPEHRMRVLRKLALGGVPVRLQRLCREDVTMEPFDDLIPTDAIVLDPITEGEGSFNIIYPEGYTEDGAIRSLYRLCGNRLPLAFSISGLSTFLENAAKSGIPVVVKPHAKWFGKEDDDETS